MKLIHEIVSQYAVNNPQKKAAEDSFGSLSYRELDSKSNTGAKMLQGLGVTAGDSVGVYVPYVKDVITCALSVWKAGGIYIPMDDAYPAERLEYNISSETQTQKQSSHAGLFGRISRSISRRKK